MTNIPGRGSPAVNSRSPREYRHCVPNRATRSNSSSLSCGNMSLRRCWRGKGCVELFGGTDLEVCMALASLPSHFRAHRIATHWTIALSRRPLHDGVCTRDHARQTAKPSCASLAKALRARVAAIRLLSTTSGHHERSRVRQQSEKLIPMLEEGRWLRTHVDFHPERRLRRSFEAMP